MSQKRELLQTCPTDNERPFKRPSPAASDAYSFSRTQDSPAPTCPDLSPQPRCQDALDSPSSCSTAASVSPLYSSHGSSHEICYGMLCGVAAQLLEDEKLVHIHAHGSKEASSYYRLQITKKRIYMLQAHDGTDIAVINTQASDALQQLDDKSLARYTAYIGVSEWTEKTISPKTQGKRIVIDIDIYLYGNHSDSLTVGRILSDAELFLQCPDFLDGWIRYDNPHEIKFASLHEYNPDSSVPAPAPSSVNNLSVDIVSTLLGDLDHPGQLTAADVNQAMVVTELKVHQKEAVDFIGHRESCDSPGAFSLFKHCVDPFGRTYWEHKVTGWKKQHRPSESIGGIVADEMGLGKTLTMITAICMTLKGAKGFANGNESIGNSVMRTSRTRATLVICPSVLLLEGWLVEISKHTARGLLKCTKYHGTAKADTAALMDSDVVLTTYATLTADSGQRNTLHSIRWYRIVLDEAHSIRHQNTKQSRAVVGLYARYRWCLTGTPIQNTLDDMGALVRFLRVPDMDQASSFRTQISGPIENGAAAGLTRLRSLLQCICLRRTKELLRLPDPDEQVQPVWLNNTERAEYCRIGVEHNKAIDEALSGKDPTAAYRGLFSAILQLRIFCNSGCLTIGAGGGSGQEVYTEDERLSLLEQGDGAICAICSCDVGFIGEEESLSAGAFLGCSHLLCYECVRRSQPPAAAGDIVNCPVCEACDQPQPHRDQAQDYTVESSSGQWQGSKLDALVQDILKHKSEKCINFSSWKKSIHLAAWYLTIRGISTCMVDGSMPLPERRRQLELFQSDCGISALLMTLGTGAVGLNLIVASRIHILEPQWNPSIEKQAIGRAVRLGQQRSVTVVRYVVQDTIEQYIQTRQKKKLHLAQLGWGGETDKSDNEKLENVMALKSLLSTV